LIDLDKNELILKSVKRSNDAVTMAWWEGVVEGRYPTFFKGVDAFLHYFTKIHVKNQLWSY